ncbi:cytochrome d ubiquinol oxidase subunit II [Gracilibacillus boraciitolerans JCM 21714]|uniref:Cytochrome d ubiquinol oxidase subunit II n=1 Tax=Gracilibacillus boraciitolerans JCM 21714 TaxID=1298598 RepID=W4VIA2_9BACI|nr:cytochrome d ubiquinol oxidase subunit II [Gracilibacillus boraciitolerans JCM 21714]
MVGFFPSTAFYYGTVLLVPASLSLVLLAIRGSYYAFSTYGQLKSKMWIYLYGFSGLLIPASLSIVLTISEGGFINETANSLELDYQALFTSPLTWSIVVLSLTSVLYISAVFLTWYADKAKDMEATALLRKYALIWSIPTMITASGIIVELRSHNYEHYQNMLELWWLFLISGLLFLATLLLLWQKRKYGLAFILLIGQFLVAFFGYGISHYPYLLYPFLTIEEGFTNEGMAVALMVAFIAGLCLLIPSLLLLLRLFLFNKSYVEGKFKGG